MLFPATSLPFCGESVHSHRSIRLLCARRYGKNHTMLKEMGKDDSSSEEKQPPLSAGHTSPQLSSNSSFLSCHLLKLKANPPPEGSFQQARPCLQRPKAQGQCQHLCSGRNPASLHREVAKLSAPSSRSPGLLEQAV